MVSFRPPVCHFALTHGGKPGMTWYSTPRPPSSSKLRFPISIPPLPNRKQLLVIESGHAAMKGVICFGILSFRVSKTRQHCQHACPAILDFLGEVCCKSLTLQTKMGHTQINFDKFSDTRVRTSHELRGFWRVQVRHSFYGQTITNTGRVSRPFVQWIFLVSLRYRDTISQGSHT